jgi:sec-independent protein translocase protein TatB
MSFGELVIVMVVAIIVVGPRKLPGLLRSAGQLVGYLRRMATEVRKESGIDQLLEAEGISKEIDTFRRLASGDEVHDPRESRPSVPAEPERPSEAAGPYDPASNLSPGRPAAGSPPAPPQLPHETAAEPPGRSEGPKPQ